MKFKHFLSTALALVMVLSLSIPVFAADYETSVSYEGTGTERYELTVPSRLKPGTSGNVTLSGTWASNRHIAVTADETVAMTSSLGGSETLDVTFAGIDLAGNNETSVSETKQVSVAAMNALFDTWTGVFYYNVVASNGSSSGSENDDGTTVTSTDWSSKVTMRNITSDEYDLLCEATNGNDSLMHWQYMYTITDTIYNENESNRVIRGCTSVQDSDFDSVTNRGPGYGFRPVFEALNPDTDCADLSVGDVVLMGSIYIGGSPLKIATVPVSNNFEGSNMYPYDENGHGETPWKLTLHSAEDAELFHVKAVYVGDGLFVCDRCVLNYISWNQINTALS